MKTSKLFLPVILLFLFVSTSFSQPTGQVYNGILLDTVKALRFDTGKMWTFDFPPSDFFEQEYGFRPTQDWFDDVRMSAIRFGQWCSSSFISEDGLIMTNNHCSDFLLPQIQKEGEDLRRDGFYAKTLEEERRVPTLFVDQLVSIQDVTNEILNAIAEGTTEEEKAKKKADKIAELQNNAAQETGLIYHVVTLYSGGRYSLYGYKRYNDVRLVLIPESELGLYGGDPDNYTYPRYSLDCAFWRAYDDEGKPVKVENFFRWSKNGAEEGEPTFVVGNPGNTMKLKTVAQLEYLRDFTYRINSFVMDEMQTAVEELMEVHPERYNEFVNNLSNIANNNKRFSGVLRGLRNPYLMARKKDFERSLKNAVMSDPVMMEKYGKVWDNIAAIKDEQRKFANELSAYNRSQFLLSGYFDVGINLVKLAEELNKPEDERAIVYQQDELEHTIDAIFPDNFDKPVHDKRLRVQAGLMNMNLGKDNPLVRKLFGGNEGDAAVNYALSKSVIATKENVIKLANQGADAILKSDDPFINFIVNTKDRLAELQKLQSELSTREAVNENLLGQAIFEVYATSIPPDGTFSLRIGDGVMKKYEYNGTIAPVKTTFYGLYDRYYSHDKKYPWSLPERWQSPPAEFNLSTPFNFASTHDIVGGSSGSAVINKNKEIIGLAFDGNIESNSGYFIYDTVENRMISVASQGMLEVIKHIYKADRLAYEMINGKMK